MKRSFLWLIGKKVLSDKSLGGLSVISLFALNRAFLFKWVWRFLLTHTSFLLSVIKVIHGPKAGDGDIVPSHRSSTFLDIIKAIDHLKKLGVHLLDLCKK